MSTPTLTEAARLLAASTLRDTIQIVNVGQPTTVGINVERPVTNVGEPIPALVQTTILQNAVEGRVADTFSVKVAQGTELVAGQAIRVVTCEQEPDLIGKVLLLDKVSLNGAAVIRKAVASDYHAVQPQGKLGLS